MAEIGLNFLIQYPPEYNKVNELIEFFPLNLYQMPVRLRSTRLASTRARQLRDKKRINLRFMLVIFLNFSYNTLIKNLEQFLQIKLQVILDGCRQMF